MFDAVCDLVAGHNEDEAIRSIDKAAIRAGFNPLSIPETQVMSADELKSLSRHPLVSLGAHTVSHRALARLDQGALDGEISQSTDYVEEITGRRPDSFAYPYGDCRSVDARTVAAVAKAGLPLAVTTGRIRSAQNTPAAFLNCRASRSMASTEGTLCFRPRVGHPVPAEAGLKPPRLTAGRVDSVSCALL